jgi:hypothetical protein
LRYRNKAFRVPKTKRNTRSKKYGKSNALPQSYRLLTSLVGDLPFNNHSGLESGALELAIPVTILSAPKSTAASPLARVAPDYGPPPVPVSNPLRDPTLQGAVR